jgi:hypothetical protein
MVGDAGKRADDAGRWEPDNKNKSLVSQTGPGSDASMTVQVNAPNGTSGSRL